MTSTSTLDPLSSKLKENPTHVAASPELLTPQSTSSEIDLGDTTTSSSTSPSLSVEDTNERKAPSTPVKTTSLSPSTPSSTTSSSEFLYLFPPDVLDHLRRTTQLDLNMASDLLYFTRQVYHLLVPLGLCFGLALLWSTVAVPTTSLFTGDTSTSSTSTSELGVNQLLNALMVMGTLIGMTCLMVVVVKCGWYRVLYVLLGLVMISVFGVTGYVVC
ncbi:hypothetical protein HMI54_005897 [Coelomomyces lativittatus]|nr:hypothetical protein HMI54_005897 [Coelomomyces lativittatus]